MAIEKGTTLRVSYQGRLADGTVFDESKNHGPYLEFQVGEGLLIAGFENAVISMNLGEEKEITIPFQEAYGERKEELVKEIPRANFPGDVEEGMGVTLGLPNGQKIPALIKKVTAEIVTIDLNHPLAGQELHFTIKLLEIVS